MDVAHQREVANETDNPTKPEHRLLRDRRIHDLQIYEHLMKNDRETNSVRKTPKKRGAFPTPRSEIESATPYIPESDQAGDQPGTQPVSPKNAENEEQ